MLCHCCPAEVRKHEMFKSSTLVTLLKMIMEVDDKKDAEWEQQLEDNYISQEDISSSA